jgi:hypothetical protein
MNKQRTGTRPIPPGNDKIREAARSQPDGIQQTIVSQIVHILGSYASPCPILGNCSPQCFPTVSGGFIQTQGDDAGFQFHGVCARARRDVAPLSIGKVLCADCLLVFYDI